jgi:hypothetical protein
MPRDGSHVGRVVFVLLFASYAYFYQGGGWNQNSRFALVRGITSRHTLRIDAFADCTRDRSVFGGHYYSDKAPGLSLAAVPVVALARPLLRVLGRDPDDPAGLAFLSHLATVLTAGLLTALAGQHLYTLAVELGASPGGALFAALTFGLGTPIWALATLFVGHAFSAGLLVLAFAAACRVGAERDAAVGADLRLGALIGACAGWATISEFPAGAPAVLIALLAVVNARPLGGPRAVRVLGVMAVTALACAAVLMAYQHLCFGSPLQLAYGGEEGFGRMQEGVFGVKLRTMTRLRRVLWAILLGDYRGLLPLAPALALAPIGLSLMVLESSRARRAALVASLVAAYYVLLNASYAYWDGGWSYGPRHAAPAIPFLCLGLAALWTAVSVSRIARWLLAVVSLYGVALTLVAVSTMPMPPVGVPDPVSDLLWPAFRDGDLSLNTQSFSAARPLDDDLRAHREPKVAFNLGMTLGLDGRGSLVPLFTLWAACAGALAIGRGGPTRAPRDPPSRERAASG